MMPRGLLLLIFWTAAAGAAPLMTAHPNAPVAPIVHRELTVITLNVAHGRGESFSQLLIPAAAFKQNLHAISEALSVYQPQLFAVQEADHASRWSGSFDHVQALAAQLSMPWYAHGNTIANWLAQYGTAVLSTLPITHAQDHVFASSWPTPSKGFTLATVAWQSTPDALAREVDVVSLHLDFLRQSVRLQQWDELLKILQDHHNPLIIMGDFNNAELAAQYLPVAFELGQIHLQVWAPQQALPSYGQQRLDWILVSQELTFTDYQVIDKGLSDHRAVMAKIRWKDELQTARTR